MNFSRVSPANVPMNPAVSDTGFAFGDYSAYIDTFYSKLQTIPNAFIVKANVYVSIDIARKMMGDNNFNPSQSKEVIFQCGQDKGYMIVYADSRLENDSVIIE